MARSKMAENEITFKTQYNGRVRRFINSGERLKKEYMPKFDKDGNWQLVETGETDLYEYIQSHALSCDINVLMARYKNGELDVLQRVQGAYGDFTQMPETYADMMNKVIEAENHFNSLPVEIREKFDHSVVKYMQSFGSPEWLDIMGLSKNDVVPAPAPADQKEEVKKDES